MVKLVLLSLLLHVIDDFVFQPICLSKLKQKSFWEKEAPDDMYKYDYQTALLIHSMSWSIMIMLPYILWLDAPDIIYGLVCIINLLIHFFIDDAKANLKKLNLWQDQLIHIGQICLTYFVFLMFI